MIKLSPDPRPLKKENRHPGKASLVNGNSNEVPQS